MKAPKEIIDKARQYERLNGAIRRLYEELTEWINENGGDGVFIEDVFIATEPSGKKQGDGEWCSQGSVGESGDSFEGVYFHESEEKTGLYLGYRYWC